MKKKQSGYQYEEDLIELGEENIFEELEGLENDLDELEEFLKEPEDENVEEVKDIKIGTVINCTRLNIREKPNTEATVLVRIDLNSEVIIDEENSTDLFYKITTASGLEGYCMKKFVEIQP